MTPVVLFAKLHTIHLRL